MEYRTASPACWHLIFGLCGRMTSQVSQVGRVLIRHGSGATHAEEEYQQKAVDTLRLHQFEGLIVIGGSGSQQGAARLAELGFPVVGIPSTIDNDLPCTVTSLGVDTAINTAVDCVDMIKETMTSHRRIAVIQVMGRGSGYLAEQVALATGAEAGAERSAMATRWRYCSSWPSSVWCSITNAI